MAHLEIVAFGRRFLTIFQLDKLEEDTEELEEEPGGPAHYIPTPMKEYPEQLGFHMTGPGQGFDREVG